MGNSQKGLTRKQHRSELRNRRRSLSPSQQRHSSHHIVSQLFQQIFFVKAKKVGIYWAADGEADVLSLTAHKRKTWYLPQISDTLRCWERQRLFFQQFDSSDFWARNKFGIIEPGYDPRFHVDPIMLDVVLVPLVGFDRDGNRLGMGKGYYDRTFEKLDTAWHKPTLVGIAHSVQECTDLSSSSWDIPLHAIVTENEVIWCG